MKVDGNTCHDLLRNSMVGKQKLGYNNKKCGYQEWREQVREKFIELIGIESIKDNACPLNFEIEKEVQKDGYKQIRFTIETEIGSVCPVYVLIPDGITEKTPTIITLAGHNSGFHNSIGEPKPEENPSYALGNGGIAVQAVREGFVAVAIEQRGMGERRPDFFNRGGAKMCAYEALTAFELGRTLLGERVWDVSRVIDVLSNFKEIDIENIGITGGSGGGTASYYCACYDERIKYSIPLCGFCTYEDSILNIFHCNCNYIPGVYEWFEMHDLACLIAPRNLGIVTGLTDDIFPIDGVRKAFETVKQIYIEAGAKDKAQLYVTPYGHRWVREVVYGEAKRVSENIKNGK